MQLDEECMLMDSCYGAEDMPLEEMPARASMSYKYTEDLLSLAKYLPHSEGSLLKVWSGVKTPLKVAAWGKALESHPDQIFAEFLITGMQEGFRIGFDRRQELRSAKRNMKSANDNPLVVEEYFQKE